MIAPVTQQTYEFEYPEGKKIEIIYVEDELYLVNGLENNGMRIRTEKDLADKIDRQIESCINMLIFLNQARNDIKRIVANHQSNRSTKEKQMVG